MSDRGGDPMSYADDQPREVDDMQRPDEVGDRRGIGWRGPAGRAGGLLAVLFLMVWTACENPLTVENPNKLTEENISSPEAFGASVGAARNNVVRAAMGMLAIMENASDESFWIGSRDAWGALDNGRVGDPTNEFTDVTWPNVGQARFTADQAIALGEQFQSEGTLPSPDLLAEAYLYGGTIYTLIADTWQRFVLPDDRLDPTTPGQPVAAEQMPTFYDTAIGYFTEGLGVVQDSELQAQLMAMRARARQAKQIRLQIQSGDPTNPGIVVAPEAASDAQAALAMSAVGDEWTFTLAFDAGLLGIDCESWAPQVWERGELQIGDRPAPDNRYFDLSNSDQTVDDVKLTDAIDTGAPDPRLVDQLGAFRSGGRNADIVEMSARELHLIVAENALANTDTTTFASEVNAVRSLDGLTDWDPGAPQVPAATILEHERNVNLIWQGRRLADHYRFGSLDPLWQATSVARQNPGTLFPISITEIRSNPNVEG